MQEVDGVQLLSRKRRHASEDGSNSRKALRLREDLAGSDEETSALNDDDDEQTTQRSGPFAHIKSAKKRHKLEREARKAKKQVERGETVDIPASVLQNGTTAQLEEDAGIVKKPKRQKEKAVAVVVEEEDNREQRRLEKHASVLKKFDKVQKKAKVSKDKQEEGSVEVPESTRTIVDPLEPIHIDTTVPTPEITYSALPSWVTAAKRITNVSTKSFASMGLQSNVVKRLQQLDFSSAMPVQQAIVPILLPPGVPGSVFSTGTDRIVPDLAVAAPTGSGKTLGYLLPIVEALERGRSSEHSLRALVVVPTRELVAQVSQLAESLIKGGSLSIGTATATTSLRDEQQKLVNIRYVHKAQEYARLSKLANILANPPEEDAEHFDDYLAAVDALDGDIQRLIDSLVDCPPDFLPEHQSAIDILVCTPGRLIEHLDNTIGFNLASLTHLVLDEADKLLDEQYDGFLERLHQEFSRSHTAEQQGSREVELRRLDLWEEQRERRVRKVVLSATMTQDIAQLQALKLHSPQLIIIGAQQGDEAENDTGTQSFELPTTLEEFCVPADDGSAKPLYLLKLLSGEILAEKLNLKQADSDDSDDTSDSNSDSESSVSSDLSDSDSASDSSTSSSASSAPSISAKLETSNVPTVLIFTASNEAALRLTYLLKRLRPRQASQVTCLTKVNSAPKITVSSSPTQPCIVIATDRAGRGLDTISGRAITHVIQYDVPRSVVSYVHRVGRTARAGRGGQAWTLYTNAEARWFLKEVTRAETIVRAQEVQKVKLQAEDERLQQAYEEALAGMKDIVQNRGRGS